MKMKWSTQVNESFEGDKKNADGSFSKQSRKASNREVGTNEFDMGERNTDPYKENIGEAVKSTTDRNEYGDTNLYRAENRKQRFSNLDPEEDSERGTTKRYKAEKNTTKDPDRIADVSEMQQTVVPSKNDHLKKILYMGIIIDGTLSFSKPYPKVYAVLEEFLNHLEAEKWSYKEIELRYGLTVFHDEPIPVLFAGRRKFTDRESEVLKELENLQFYDGNESGRENLKEAIAQQLEELNSVPEAADVKHCYKGILMFTDSLPEDGDMSPDFTQEIFERNGKEYPNYGLRFADFYAYNDDFVPAMRMVNRNGREDENEKNTGVYHDIHDLLNQDSETTAAFVERMIRTIAVQASMD